MIAIYKVTLTNNNQDTIINEPTTNTDVNYLENMKLIENAGIVNNFNFTIKINNTGYDLIIDRLALIKVEDIDTGEVIFDGRIYDNEGGMDSEGIFYKDVFCESELAYLNDTKARAWDIENITAPIFLQQIIDNHNSHTSVDKQFQLGTIEYTNLITCKPNFENSLDCILTFIVNVIGEGYLRVRKVDEVRYLDYVQVYPGQSDDIVVGDNIKDFKFKPDTTNIISRVIPRGKDELTIASVNDGKDYLDNLEAIGEIGIVEGTLDLTDIEDANTLMTTAQSKLEQLGKPVYSLDTNILDLQKIGLKPYGFICGTSLTIKADMINFNETFDIIKKETDLLSPQNTKITLNNKTSSWSNRQLALQRAAQILSNIITPNKNVNTFSLEGIIDSLKNQITASGAYQTAEVIEGKGILLENTDETSPDYGALYLGPGIFTIASEKVDGKWNWRTFGTGKGFVADLITAGTLIADRIAGGTLSSLDNTFKISLAAGLLTTFASDTGYKALELENRTIKFYDITNENEMIGQIEVERTNGSPSIPLLATGIKQGAYFAISDIENPSTNHLLKIENGVTPGIRKAQMNLSDFLITSYNGTGGILVSTDSNGDIALKVFGKVDMNGWDLLNVGTINMSTGVGTSANGWNGTITLNGVTITVTNGVITNAVG